MKAGEEVNRIRRISHQDRKRVWPMARHPYLNSVHRTAHRNINNVRSTIYSWGTNSVHQTPLRGANNTRLITDRWETDNSQLTSRWDVNNLQSIVSYSENETLGARLKPTYISQEVRRLVEPILKVLPEMEKPKIVKEVRELVSIIIELILELHESNFDISNLPPLVGTKLDDGSLLIEWFFLNYRVGFVIEEDPPKSIWYLVSKSASLDSNSSGSLINIDKKALLTKLISYVAVNS